MQLSEPARSEDRYKSRRVVTESMPAEIGCLVMISTLCGQLEEGMNLLNRAVNCGSVPTTRAENQGKYPY